ncbi:hypothetical protein 1013_scaffold47_00060 [Bacteriophage sp.]|nr:hypothetical protein 1013_scaffold47_00060 [Bacteriophage sp.]
MCHNLFNWFLLFCFFFLSKKSHGLFSFIVFIPCHLTSIKKLDWY